MSNCLGHSLKVHLKLYVAKKSYNAKFFSSLRPINYKVISFKPKANFLSFNQGNKLQHRSFQIPSFYVGIYNSVTSTTASQLLKESLIQCHDITGLPWWSVIILTSVAFKLFVSFPFGVYQQYLVARINNSKVELNGIGKKKKEEILIEAKKKRWTREKANLELNREIRKQWRILIVKNNCHPFKIVILGLVQLPVWFLISLTLRKFASDSALGISDSVMAALQFQVGGLFWSPNLTLPDSTLILSTIITLVSLATIEINSLSSTHVLNLFSKISKNIFRFCSLLAFFISANIPSCVSLFWAVSTILSAMQSLLLLSPRLKKFFKIPETSHDLKKPYSHIYKSFIEKWYNFGMKLTKILIRK